MSVGRCAFLPWFRKNVLPFFTGVEPGLGSALGTCKANESSGRSADHRREVVTLNKRLKRLVIGKVERCWYAHFLSVESSRRRETQAAHLGACGLPKPRAHGTVVSRRRMDGARTRARPVHRRRRAEGLMLVRDCVASGAGLPAAAHGRQGFGAGVTIPRCPECHRAPLRHLRPPKADSRLDQQQAANP